jgi:outer membrane phospholipase A
MKPKFKKVLLFLFVFTTSAYCVQAQSATGNTTSGSVNTPAADGTENVTIPTQKTKSEQNWLIATTDDVLDGGSAIAFEVVKPSSLSQWSDMLKLSLLHDDKTYEILLTADQQKSSNDAVRRRYFGKLPKNISGWVRVSLIDAKSNQLALLLTQPGVTQWTYVESTAATEDGEVENVLAVDEPALSINEPMYFVVGGSTDSVDTRDATARFQLSFKYRLFDADSLPVEWLPLLSDLYFGYTQSSLWDVGADSAPFNDTSYRPSFFWQGATGNKDLLPELLRTGYEHESNGKEGENSRSLNTLFVQPFWRTVFSDKRTLIFAPKVYGYLNKEGNTDIQHYRGYADWVFRYGREDGLIMATQLRLGTSGRGSAQFDFTYPFRRALFSRTGGFMHLQLFTGYGETLLDYNIDHGTQIRVGFSFVR